VILSETERASQSRMTPVAASTLSDGAPVADVGEAALDDSLLLQPRLVPARMLNEFAYCPRLAYLEWVEGEFADSADTVEGRQQHARVDAEDLTAPEDRTEEDDWRIHARSLLLSSERYGLISRLDLIEFAGDRATPVDYKHGGVPETPERSWEPERVQLCAQALVLEDNGFTVESGIIYYVQAKTRVPVSFSDELRRRTLALLAELRQTLVPGRMPPPLLNSAKCNRCSLLGICLPDETNALRGEAEPVPRLVPGHDDRAPVYVQAQGAAIGLREGRLVVKVKGEVAQEVKLIDVGQVAVFGNAQISTALIRELAQRDAPVCFYSYGGWLQALTAGMTHKNIGLRIAQFKAAGDATVSLGLARRFVSGKVRNCRTLLRRNHSAPCPAALRELARLTNRAESAPAAEVLLGIEGTAARIYFQHFAGMLKSPPDWPPFEFAGRNRRPPADPVNALLSFVYALLVKDVAAAILKVGLDPHLGFFHRPRYGRPALALDLAEEFRPLIGDSVVLNVINNGEVRLDDFAIRCGAAALTPKGRRALIAAYERRLDAQVTHPLFGYTITYRRVLEVQARLLSRYLTGDLADYRPFVTR